MNNFFIARDLDYNLYLYTKKPFLSLKDGVWLNQDDTSYMSIDEQSFTNVKPGECVMVEMIEVPEFNVTNWLSKEK